MSAIGLATPNTPVEAPVTSQEALQATLTSQPDLSTKEGIIVYIKSKDWKGQEEHALAIAVCESNLSAKAFNGKGKDFSIGIYQINLHGNLALTRPSREWLENPRNNIDYAHGMFLKEGFKPWSCSKKI